MRDLVQPGAEKAVCYCTTGSIHFSLFGPGEIRFSLLAVSFRSEAPIKSIFLTILSVKLRSNDEAQGRDGSEGQREAEMS